MFELLAKYTAILRWSLMIILLLIFVILLNSINVYMNTQKEKLADRKNKWEHNSNIIDTVILFTMLALIGWGAFVFFAGAIRPEDRMPISVFANLALYSYLPLAILIIVTVSILDIIFPLMRKKIGF